jgi:hypothetical protein
MHLLAAGRAYLERHGRVLDRRLAGVIFDGDPLDGALAALEAYRNADGGFGWALEPDVGAPTSQPVCAEMALRTYDLVGHAPRRELAELCDHLASLGDPGVGLLTERAFEHPVAAHFDATNTLPNLNPTAALCGFLHRFGVQHAWVHDATAWCLDQLRTQPMPNDAHALRGVLLLIEHHPAADDLAEDAVMALREASWLRHDADDPGYGLTPFHFAPTPESRWRSAFTDELIERSLERLARDQQADGGWPVTWEPPTTTALAEWRSYETLRALRVLCAYGRLSS